MDYPISWLAGENVHLKQARIEMNEYFDEPIKLCGSGLPRNSFPAKGFGEFIKDRIWYN